MKQNSHGDPEQQSDPGPGQDAAAISGRRNLILQSRILEGIARGRPAADTLAKTISLAEEEYPELSCGLVLVDESALQVHEVLAGRLPEGIRARLEELKPDPPYFGPVAKALRERVKVVSKEVRADDRWAGQGWVDLLTSHNFNFAQATPVIGASGQLLAVFAIYLKQPPPASSEILGLSETVAHLVSIALEREASERALRETSQRLSVTVEGAQLALWDYNVDNGKIVWSARAQELFGVPENSTYEFFTELLHPDDRERVNRAVEEALRKNIPYSEEYRVRRADGEGYRWVNSMGRGFLNAAGEMENMRGVAMDITVRREAVDRLKASESLAKARAEELEALIEFAPAPVCMALDPECREIRANRAARETFHISEEEYSSLTPAEGTPPLAMRMYREGIELPPSQAWLQRAIATRQMVEDDLEVRFPDGSFSFVNGRALPLFNDDGSVRGAIGAFLDLSARRSAELSLRVTERNLRVALDAMNMGMWEYSVDAEVFKCTERCQTMMGLPGNTADWSEWFGAILEDDRAAVREKIQGALVPGAEAHLQVEFRVRGKDGRTAWMSAFGKTVVNGTPRLVGTVLDITERKLTERAVEENAERFRFLAESLPAKIFTAGVNGEITYLNEQWASYTGRPLEDVALLGWREFVHPHDVEEKERVWKTAIHDGIPFEFEHRFRREDGQYRWHLSRAQPMRDAAGHIITWIGANMDVDDLKQAQFALEESESRSRLAVEAAGMGFWDWSIGHSVRWSAEMSRIMGMDPHVGEGTYQVFLERIHPEDRGRVAQAMEHSEITGEDFSQEFRVVRPDGEVRWVAEHGRPFFGPSRRRAVRMLGVVRDVTERKDFEDRLRRHQEELRAALASAEHAREEAEAASHAKDQFLAVLSHELRTPLTPVLMAASTMLLDTDLPEDTREVLEMIRRNIQTEARLINDLLDLTRITRNQVELQLAPMNLHETVTRAVHVCRTEIEEKSLRFHLELSATQARVEGDADRLQQVFWNLIKNAVKFTPANGEITVRSSNDENGFIKVEIGDSGIGISPDILPRIFNPFEQGGSSHARQYGGLGLGLAISKATVDAHDGILRAASPGPNQGTILTVILKTLPLE